MIKLAITGGIGSGKTYVSSLFEEMGIPVYNADDNSKMIVATDKALHEKLVSVVGNDCFINGELNKKRLADFIFSSDENRLLVNSIIHPYVFKDFIRWCDEHSQFDLVAMESAILFESGFNKYIDSAIMVYAPIDVRIQRVLKRDKCNTQQVMARISSQMDDKEKCNLADYIVYNDGSQELRPQINDILGKLKCKIDNNNLGV